MICPVDPSHGEMYDNRGNKKNPKGPDFTCKNPSCKWQLDKESGEWIRSVYKTGVWEEKAHALPPKEQVFKPTTTPGMGAAQTPMQPQTPPPQEQTQGDILNREGLAKSALESGRVLDEALQLELSQYETWVKFGSWIPF